MSEKPAEGAERRKCRLAKRQASRGERQRSQAKQAWLLAVPGGSCGGLEGVPSSPPPTACHRNHCHYERTCAGKASAAVSKRKKSR